MSERVTSFFFWMFILAAIVVVVVLVYALIAGWFNYSNGTVPCYSSQDVTYKCREYQIDQCLADERWDEATCIKIVGGGK